MSYKLQSTSHWISAYPVSVPSLSTVSVHFWYRNGAGAGVFSTSMFRHSWGNGYIQLLEEPATPDTNTPNTFRTTHYDGSTISRMYAAGANAAASSTWRPVSIVIRGNGTHDIWVDGVQVGAIERDQFPGNTFGTFTDWSFYGGGDQTSGTIYYAEVAIWTNYALTSADIANLHGNKWSPHILATIPRHYWTLYPDASALVDQGSALVNLQVSGAVVDFDHPSGIVYSPSGPTKKFRIAAPAVANGTVRYITFFANPTVQAYFSPLTTAATANNGYFKVNNPGLTLGTKYPCLLSGHGASDAVDAPGGAAWAEGIEE